MLGKVLILAIFVSCAFVNAEAQEKDGRMLALFNVVQFPNDQCTSGTNGRNGTCYTAEECSNRGGSASGDCAEGFGVCCIFVLACGDSSADNNTYLVQASAANPTTPCTYSICKMSDDICRIRLDFTSLTLTGPNAGTTSSGNAAAANNGGQVGQCAVDSLTVTGGVNGAPVICGSNDAGSHMFIDVANNCAMVAINTGADSATNRAWDIRVTQFACGDQSAGPRGCLQYLTASTGTIQSFNFPPASTTMIGADATHLANQMYSICIRRNSGMCVICYTAITPTGTAAETNQLSFGLSISSANNAAKSLINTSCSTDYIQIPGGNGNTMGLTQTALTNRYCGRIFSTDTAKAIGDAATVCTMQAPFAVHVNFDGTEVATSITSDVNEMAFFPGGIVGFRLVYTQGAGNCS